MTHRELNNAIKPSRTIAWSSTTNTRVRFSNILEDSVVSIPLTGDGLIREVSLVLAAVAAA